MKPTFSGQQAMHARSWLPHTDWRHVLACMRLTLLALLWLTAQPAAAARLTVVYPGKELVDERDKYTLQVLALALHKSGLEHVLRPTASTMPQSRALQELAQGQDITVVWSMTSKAREKDLRAIRIPIDKGLLGWRIFLINKNSQADFAKVKTIEDLKQFSAGQGHDWPDTDILKANGLPVQGSPSYEGLFKMLHNKHFDYFPRSIMEIWHEEKNHPGMTLEVEQTLLLQYPTAMYFFVNKNDPVLGDALERGLQIAIKDGSFDTLFNQYHGDYIKRARLKERTRFQLKNPLLPAETPLQQKELWFDL